MLYIQWPLWHPGGFFAILTFQVKGDTFPGIVASTQQPVAACSDAYYFWFYSSFVTMKESPITMEVKEAEVVNVKFN